MKGECYILIITLLCMKFCTAGATYFVNENSTAVLRCPFKADSWNGPPNLMVYTIGTLFNPILPHKDRLNVAGSENYLQISNVQHAGAGEYRCTGTYNGVKNSSATQLALTVRPSSDPLISQIPNGHVKLGGNVTLTCKVLGGNPTANISWQCDGFIYKEDISTINESLSSITLDIQKSYINKICTCTAYHPLWSTAKMVNVLFDVQAYLPSVHMEPKYNPYIIYYKQRNIVLSCIIDDANPSNAVIYEWNSPSGTVNTLNFTISNVNKSHSGQYSCASTNIAGTSNRTNKQINVHYGPMISNISNQHDIIEGNNLLVYPIVDANPVAKLVWWTKQNDANFRYISSVLRINKIDRTSSGNYSCYVMNTLTPSGMAEINRTNHKTFYVNVLFKPFLNHSRPYSPSHVTTTENNNIHLTLTLTANPTPTIEWTFRAETDWDSCNFITIVSKTTTNGLCTSSTIFIDNVNSSNFGDYAFTASNTAGVFSRRFVVMKEAWLRQDMLSSTQENTGMFVAGIVTLAVGLLSLTISAIFVVRNSLKNKTLKSSKTDEYTGVQRSNPAFTDAYTTLHSDIEPRVLQEQIINTYEECGRTPEAHAYSSVDKMESEPSQPQQHDVNTYEECGKRIEAHAYDLLDK